MELDKRQISHANNVGASKKHSYASSLFRRLIYGWETNLVAASEVELQRHQQVLQIAFVVDAPEGQAAALVSGILVFGPVADDDICTLAAILRFDLVKTIGFL